MADKEVKLKSKVNLSKRMPRFLVLTVQTILIGLSFGMTLVYESPLWRSKPGEFTNISTFRKTWFPLWCPLALVFSVLPDILISMHDLKRSKLYINVKFAWDSFVVILHLVSVIVYLWLLYMYKECSRTKLISCDDRVQPEMNHILALLVLTSMQCLLLLFLMSEKCFQAMFHWKQKESSDAKLIMKT